MDTTAQPATTFCTTTTGKAFCTNRKTDDANEVKMVYMPSAMMPASVDEMKTNTSGLATQHTPVANLLSAAAYYVIGVPIAAGILYPLTGFIWRSIATRTVLIRKGIKVFAKSLGLKINIG